ncbi:MAG: hypothetical protein DRK00_10705, partial [Thermoprotei archaeon]
VLLDFNADKWVNAFKLGAHAVVFIDSYPMTRFDAISKVLTVPVNFPRAYLPGREGLLLKERVQSGDEVLARLNINMKWITVKVPNIIGVIRGREIEDEIIVVSSYYDTWSITPALAPGADESTGISSLLWFAKYLVENPPKRTVWLVALSGHWQFLAGAREFVEKFFFEEEKKIMLFISLDLSTDTNKIGTLYASRAYYSGGSSKYPKYAKWLMPRIWSEIIPALEQQTGRRYRDEIVENGILQVGWDLLVPSPYYLDCEAFSIANGLGLGLHTTRCFRRSWHTPMSTLETVNFDNLVPQLEAAFAISYGLIESERIDMSWEEIKPQRLYVLAGLGSGFLTVYGQVRLYNSSKMWYQPVTSKEGQILIDIVYQSGYYDPFRHIIVEANDDGSFEVHGIAALTNYGGEWGARFGEVYNRILIQGYVLDWETGKLKLSPDLGPYGSGSFPLIFIADYHPKPLFPVVFESRPLVIFDLLDPRTLNSLIYLDPATLLPRYTVPWTLSVYDIKSWEMPIRYYIVADPRNEIAVIFLEPGTYTGLILKTGIDYAITGILVNATPDSPLGEGFSIEPGIEELRVPLTAIQFAKDMYILTSTRLDKVRRYQVRDYVTEYLSNKSDSLYDEMLAAVRNNNYSYAYSLAYALWSLQSQCYISTRELISNVENSGLVFFVLLIPFVYVLERALYHGRGLKSSLFILLSYMALILMFWFIHPSMEIMHGWPIPLAGVSLLILSSLLMYFTLNETKLVLSRLKEKVIGKHEIERPTTALLASFTSMGLENIKRRKIRSTLILTTITLITLSLTLFTSTVSMPFVKSSEVESPESRYSGILLKREFGQPSAYINDRLKLLARALIGDESRIVVAERVWYYPPLLFLGYTELKSSTTSTEILAVAGLSPREPLMSEEVIMGRWFEPYDENVCILTSSLAELLNVSVGDTVEFQGLKLTVIG